jgi:4-oxalmesaconate hydratase
VLPHRNILFASEMIGAVRDIDPCSGHHFDDTRRYVEAAGLDAAALADVQEHNARAVYPRLDALLRQQGC